jgi:hypothetical protein
MFRKKLERIAPDAGLIKCIVSRFTRLVNVGLWLRASVITSVRRRVMVDRNIPFNGSLPKPLRSRL